MLHRNKQRSLSMKIISGVFLASAAYTFAVTARDIVRLIKIHSM
jgi:hypothetical protein